MAWYGNARVVDSQQPAARQRDIVCVCVCLVAAVKDKVAGGAAGGGSYMGLWRLPSLTCMTLRISSRTGRTSSCCDSRCHVSTSPYTLAIHLSHRQSLSRLHISHITLLCLHTSLYVSPSPSLPASLARGA